MFSQAKFKRNYFPKRFNYSGSKLALLIEHEVKMDLHHQIQEHYFPLHHLYAHRLMEELADHYICFPSSERLLQRVHLDKIFWFPHHSLVQFHEVVRGVRMHLSI